MNRGTHTRTPLTLARYRLSRAESRLIRMQEKLNQTLREKYELVQEVAQLESSKAS